MSAQLIKKSQVVVQGDPQSIVGRKMFPFVLNDHDRVVVSLQILLQMFGHDPFELLPNFRPGQFRQRSRRLDLQAVFSRNPFVAPFDFEKKISPRPQRVIPPNPHFPPQPHPVQVCETGGQPRVVKIDTTDNGYAIVVNQPPAIRGQQHPQLANIHVRQGELHFPAADQVGPVGPIVRDLKQRIGRDVGGIPVHNSTSQSRIQIDVGNITGRQLFAKF